MLLNIVYLLIGVMVGFLVKHEIDLKHRKRRIEKRLQSFASISLEPYDTTLRDVQELNNNLVLLQKKKEVQ
jgi:hypothetical protein